MHHGRRLILLNLFYSPYLTNTSRFLSQLHTSLHSLTTESPKECTFTHSLHPITRWISQFLNIKFVRTWAFRQALILRCGMYHNRLVFLIQIFIAAFKQIIQLLWRWELLFRSWLFDLDSDLFFHWFEALSLVVRYLSWWLALVAYLIWKHLKLDFWHFDFLTFPAPL